MSAQTVLGRTDAAAQLYAQTIMSNAQAMRRSQSHGKEIINAISLPARNMRRVRIAVP